MASIIDELCWNHCFSGRQPWRLFQCRFIACPGENTGDCFERRVWRCVSHLFLAPNLALRQPLKPNLALRQH
jgi:hypothetical protein